MSKFDPRDPRPRRGRQADYPDLGEQPGALTYDSTWAAFTIVMQPLHRFCDNHRDGSTGGAPTCRAAGSLQLH